MTSRAAAACSNVTAVLRPVTHNRCALLAHYSHATLSPSGGPSTVRVASSNTPHSHATELTGTLRSG